MKSASVSILEISILAAVAAGASVARAADHDDTNALKATGRHDGRLTDLHVFTVGSRIVFAVGTNPNIAKSASSYQFPSDLVIRINIDGHSHVRFGDVAAARFGGTVDKPSKISADQVLTVTFDAAGAPHLDIQGIARGLGDDVKLFAGLRDDPFIRGPRTERNVASVVIDADLRAFTSNQTTLLVWANTEVPSASGPIGDLGARALRSQFPGNLSLNDLPPSQHESVLGVPPDVIIFDTTRAAAFPNGRALSDDVVDLVCALGTPESCLFSSDCPPSFDNSDACQPATNDVPFLAEFPYLAAPHAPCGDLGQACCTVVAQCSAGTCTDGVCR